MNTITILTYNSELINLTNVIKVFTYKDKFDNKYLRVDTTNSEEEYDIHDIKEYVIS